MRKLSEFENNTMICVSTGSGSAMRTSAAIL